ncbi:phage holin, LLH family [uncultured Fenollaria sp.]|uniref:phage holin, LLH family n=1 Tax=uncultured Fenollaria sp. TaxID=1686315 RepID=UPI0025E82BF4|nr:phage holin, LLH family [uncultured Fenollaria sp.]
MDKEILVNIILAVIAFLGSIITGVLVPYIKKSKNKNNMMLLKLIVDTLVTAAEEIFVGKGKGDEKYKWVYDELVKRYPKIDEKEAKILIESAVNELHNVQNSIK